MTVASSWWLLYSLTSTGPTIPGKTAYEPVDDRKTVKATHEDISPLARHRVGVEDLRGFTIPIQGEGPDAGGIHPKPVAGGYQ